MTNVSLHDALFSTRAMRHLKPDPIAKEDLEYIIEAATMAPSAGNLQMWAFVIVTEPELIKSIAAAYQEVGNSYIRDGVLQEPDLDDGRRRVYSKAMHNVEHLDEAPTIIVPCLTMPCPDDADIASGFFGSIYPAIQNMLLAARSRGIGSVLLTLATDLSPIKPELSTPVSKLLELPDNVQSVALIPMGYPRGNWGRPHRNPWQSCTHWNRW